MSDVEKIRDLLDEGLTHYGLGEVHKALGVWKRVLELEPGNLRALEYIRFVEENWAPNQDREQDPYRPDEGTDPKAEQEGASKPEDGAVSGPSPSPEPAAPADEPAASPTPAQADEVSGGAAPVQSDEGQWGDLYDFNKGADKGEEPSPEPMPEPVPEPVPAPESVPEKSSPSIPEVPAEVPGAGEAVDQGGEELPPEAEGDEGFSSWNSQVWRSEPLPEADKLPEPPPENLDKIESSTLPARPEPPVDQAELDASLKSQPASEAAGEAASEPAAAEPEPVPEPVAAEPADAEPEPVGDDGEVRDATDGWGTLGAAVKTDPELRIDPELQSAFTKPPTDPSKMVLQPLPPFTDSQPPPGDLAKEPAPVSKAPAPEPLNIESLIGEPAGESSQGARPVTGALPVSLPLPTPEAGVPLERFSLETTPPPAGPTALGLVGSLDEPEDDEGSGEFDSVTALMSGVSDMLELDDFSGAVELLDKVLDQDPDHGEAARLREDAESELVKMYESKIGDMERVPEVRMASDEIIWLNLDHRAGFLLSMIDGQTSYEDLMAVSGLPRLDVMRILVQLLQEKVIDVS